MEYGVFMHQEGLVPELPDNDVLTNWIERIIGQESRTLGSVYYVFLDDAALLEINQTYLQHDTYTDIITFPYERNPVEAEIYISAERVRANAAAFGIPVLHEFMRVMAHGVLHVCGWDDDTQEQATLMRRREDACLVLFGLIPPDYRLVPPS